MRAWNRLANASLLACAVAVAACGGGGGKDGQTTTYTISGTVTGAASVTVTLTGAAARTTTTNAGGAYSFSGLANGAYSVTPSKAGYGFAPSSRPVTVSGADVAGQDFAATAVRHQISGAVTGTYTGVVVLNLTGAAPGTTTAGVGGAYAFIGLADGSYAVTPSLAGYAFNPPSRTVTVSGTDVTGQDFAATLDRHTVSGKVSGDILEGVRIDLTGKSVTSLFTPADGTYSFSFLESGAYTVTPSKFGYTFDPPSRSVTVAGADAGGVDFVAASVAPGTHLISGRVTGAVAEGVTIWLGGAKEDSTTTGPGGDWGFAGLADGNYTVTASLLDPSGTYHVFSPPRRAVTVAGADVTGLAFAGTPLADFGSFAGLPSGADWDTGQHTALQESGVAILSSAIDAPARSTTYGSAAVLVPPAGRLTKLEAVVEVVGSGTGVTGDAQARAGIDLLFQPLADRVASPDNQTNALYVRLALQQTASGLVALRQIFECTAPDCTTTQGVGSVSSGGTAWPAAGLGSIAADTPYTVSIEFLPPSQFKFSLSGGTHTTAVTTTLDLSSVSSPPFPIDLSQANFHRARLFTHVRGVSGGAGTGGSIAALFDDVRVGVNGQAPALFDDFATGTMLDPLRWTAGGDLVEVFQGNLQARLLQRNSPEVSGLTLDRGLVPAPTALQARVRVQDLTKAGSGQVGARLAAALYNDGSAGLGTQPDVNKASSQVGDVIAQVSLTDTDVSFAVVRCNVAVCTGPGAIGAGHTFVVPRTSLRTTTVDTDHQLLLRWDPQTHLVVFQVDGLRPAVVDPTAGPTGLPVVSAPHRGLWQIANHATAAAPGVDFAAGSAGTIQSLFSFVKRL